jgi:hypothetical protein
LKRARKEIWRKTLKRGNSEFDEDRVEELREAELWLATARLYPIFGERIALVYPESNLSGLGAATIGADTPPPSGPGSKGEYWAQFMEQLARKRGLELLQSPSTTFALALSKWQTPTWQTHYQSCLS